MRGFSFGAALMGVLLAFGCGKTNGDTRDADSGQSGAVGAAGKGTGSAGAQAMPGAGATTGASTGAGGGPTLPPDGEIPPAVALHKLDLLLMIDNSHEMLEKQRLLKDAVLWLLGPSGPALSADDIHVGVITSSLGSHGASGAKDVCVGSQDNDHAHLLGASRPGLKSFRGSGFLAWGPDAEPDLDQVLADLDPMLSSAGEHGCGYEASLEAWFRFLVDPEPPLTVVVAAGSSVAAAADIDATILSQRAAFLRPDSVLAIVMLTDENDCSIQDQGYGWLIARASPMYRATTACENPNDPCCQSCAETAANVGCPPISSDPACAQGTMLSSGEDDLNLRCWEQKRRFGFDLLEPISRYHDALTRQLVLQRSTGVPVVNPIFAGSGLRRHPSQVILTGIVGVPWQDLADVASLSGAGLTNLTAAELEKQGRWDIMLGNPDASLPVPPKDPFMLETPADRAVLSGGQEHPLVHEPLVPAGSQNPLANSINGHETTNLGNRELQAACMFPLATPRVCDQAAFDDDRGCRCFEADLVYDRAACQPPSGGPAGTTQYFDYAYPGLRQLQLLKALGDNAVTASICPKVTEPDASDFGYRPAMRALAARLERAFNP